MFRRAAFSGEIMNRRWHLIITALSSLFIIAPAHPQEQTNCFLLDAQPRTATIPQFVDSTKSTQTARVTVTIFGLDTLGQISPYVYGNALAVWVSTNQNNPTLVGHVKKFAPTLLRYPGGSWSDVYFWNGIPSDIPSTIPDGIDTDTLPDPLYPQSGLSHVPTMSSYLDMCGQVGAQGLITVNYGYARYGLSADPVAKAAHLAADWVRYDNGHTKFWEIGNESAGPWEAGYKIDTTTNQDGQPTIVTGQLYGKHFKVFVDSMKAAAAQVGTTIYIGGQILHFDGTNDSNPANRTWNQGFFSEVGDAADFYVMHNYFGMTAMDIQRQVDNARNELNANITFIRQDIANKHATDRPVALTEWNCSGPDIAKTSIANGMQAVAVFCELMKNNFGMSARWLLANWRSDGMFYYGDSAAIPRWTPRPDFYYVYYLPRFTGDHVLKSFVKGTTEVLAYASTFSSGHTGVVLLNKGTTNRIVRILPDHIGVGERYYVFSLTGSDASALPQSVVVNGYGQTTSVPWGPLDSLESIRAWRYPVGDTILVVSPGSSVQFILIDNGSHVLAGVGLDRPFVAGGYALEQNYPNPFNPTTVVSYQLPALSEVEGSALSDVRLSVYDLLGREVAVLVNERKAPGRYEVRFDASGLSSGVYLCRMTAMPSGVRDHSIAGESNAGFSATRSMVLIK
jgi:hypothetical protein